MTTVFINPGTGPCIGTTRRNADANMRAFIRDMGLTGRVRWWREGPIDGGRYDYKIALRSNPKRTVEVSMPGLPLDQVRCSVEGKPAPGEPLFPPRLYVDGNSWFWEYAVPCAREGLGLKETP